MKLWEHNNIDIKKYIIKELYQKTNIETPNGFKDAKNSNRKPEIPPSPKQQPKNNIYMGENKKLANI